MVLAMMGRPYRLELIRNLHQPSLGVLFLLALSFSGCQQRTQYFREMEIDPKTLTVKVNDSFLGLYFGASGVYYFKFLSTDGRYTIDHYEWPDKQSKAVRYNAFFVDAQNRLITRTKYHELLRGPFGTVSAQTTYFYAEQYGEKWTDFETALYMNDIGSEPGRELADAPPHLPQTVSAVSVIRVFKAAPEYVVVSANYAPDGYLESLSVHGSKGGNWIHTNYLDGSARGFQVGRSIGDRPETRAQFGLPREFPIAEYASKREPPFAATSFPNVLDVVNFHYQRDLWVEQDLFPAGGPHAHRYLVFKVTPEDETLEPIDSHRLFGQFPYTRTWIQSPEGTAH